LSLNPENSVEEVNSFWRNSLRPVERKGGYVGISYEEYMDGIG
jgi:hypothetical protein